MIRVAIVDNEYDFAARVKHFFEENYQEDFLISTFNSCEELDSAKEIDIAVISERCMACEAGMNDKFVLITILTEDTVQSVNNGIPTIPKYQKAENMHMQFIELYALREKKKVEREIELMPPQLIVFLSALPYSGTTTLAHACAVRANEQGKKSLVISMKNAGGGDMAFGISADYTMETYLECGLTGSTAYGVDYLHVKKKFAHSYNESIINGIKKIIDVNVYKYIILDIDFDYSDFTKDILKLCNKTVITVPCTIAGVNAVNAVESAFKDADNNMAYMMSKTGIVYNGITGQNSHYADNSEFATVGGIKMVENSGVRECVSEISCMKFLDNIL